MENLDDLELLILLPLVLSPRIYKLLVTIPSLGKREMLVFRIEPSAQENKVWDNLG